MTKPSAAHREGSLLPVLPAQLPVDSLHEANRVEQVVDAVVERGTSKAS